MRGRVVSSRHISQPVALTQSYDPINGKFTETFSVGLVKLSGTKRMRLRNLVNQGFYFRTTNAIDTPVTVGIFTTSQRMRDIIDRAPPGMFTVQADPETGIYQTYVPNVNPEILEVANKEVNPFYPHRFALYDVDEALYDVGVSARGLISQFLLHEALLTQGTSFLSPSDIDIKSQGAYLLIVPFLASLKKTELACASRLSFTLEEVQADPEDEED